MRDENILNINAANGVSIAIMGIAGYFGLQLLARVLKINIKAPNDLTSQQGASPASGISGLYT